MGAHVRSSPCFQLFQPLFLGSLVSCFTFPAWDVVNQMGTDFCRYHCTPSASFVFSKQSSYLYRESPELVPGALDPCLSSGILALLCYFFSGADECLLARSQLHLHCSPCRSAPLSLLSTPSTHECFLTFSRGPVWMPCPGAVPGLGPFFLLPFPEIRLFVFACLY